MNYSEDSAYKKEKVLIEYRKSYSLESAFVMVGLSKEEETLLRNDELFMHRIAFEDASIRGEIFDTLLQALRSEDPKLARGAANDLGRILDKERFTGSEPPNKGIIPDVVMLVGKKVLA